MRIELVVPSLVPAGMEMVVARLGRGLAGRGHEIGFTVLEFVGDVGETLRAEGFRVARVGSPGVRTIVFPTRLTRWFREQRPDVVHVHSGAWLKAARAAALAHVPRVVHTAHGLLDVEPWHGPLFKRWAARHTDVVVAVSRPLHAYLETEVGLRSDAIRVIVNGIDPSVFAPGARSGAIRNRFGLSDDCTVIGHVARFSPVKNHACLVAAFAQTVRARPDTFLVLVGDGPLRTDIENRTRELGIADRVGFAGHCPDVVPVYRDLDIFVLSSNAEGTSMSILEAMACGIPVIATAVGGTPELLDHGRAGVLVPPSDPGALASALGAMVDDRAARVRFASIARERIRTSYSEESVLDAYERAYGWLPTPANGIARCAE